MRRLRFLSLLAVLAAACSSTSLGPVGQDDIGFSQPDAHVPSDSGASRDTGSPGSMDASPAPDAAPGMDAAPPDAGMRDPCNVSLTCADCTGKAACGWCDTTGRCERGTSAGPTQGMCAAWDFNPLACIGPRGDAGTQSDPCRASFGCDDCVAKSGCGFCPSTKLCELGNAMGPAQGMCPDWTTGQGSCASASDAGGAPPDSGMRPVCGLSVTCDDCTRQASCGWCATTMECRYGTFGGPASGTCPDWQYFSGDCGGGGPTAQTCAARTNCLDCSDVPGCGWCASSRVCVPGGPGGPSNGSCVHWEYSAQECDTCGTLATCAACTLQNGCGWCSEKSQCDPGTAFGPTFGFCAGWEYTQAACMTGGPGSDPCAINTTCGDCASKSGCGWCETDGRCESGSSVGPAFGFCPSWSFVPSACGHGGGPPPQPCSDNLTCLECTALSGCGWCGEKLACSEGNGGGPSVGSCALWEYTPPQCGAGPVDPCQSAGTCTDCASRIGCGWCATSALCESGTSQGPSVGSCGTWDWTLMSCGFDPCSTSATCTECDTRAACGWCESTSSCKTGTAMGPADGLCATWDYTLSMCPGPTDPCTSNTSCTGCIALLNCGWCSSTAQCLTGVSAGPTLGMCADWRFTTCN